MSSRHSDRAKTHKHKVQRVNSHSLASPRLPSTASEHLFMAEAEGEARSPFTPSGDPWAWLQGVTQPSNPTTLVLQSFTSPTYTCLFGERVIFLVESGAEAIKQLLGSSETVNMVFFLTAGDQTCAAICSFHKCYIRCALSMTSAAPACSSPVRPPSLHATHKMLSLRSLPKCGSRSRHKADV